MDPRRTSPGFWTAMLVVLALLVALVLVAISMREPEHYLDLLKESTTALTQMLLAAGLA